MEEENIDNYYSELNTWIGKQGFFFQLTQGVRLLGFSSELFFSLFRVILKTLALLLIIAVALFTWLAISHTKPAFSQKFAKKIKGSLNAEKVVLTKLKGGVSSDVEIAKFFLTGTEESFFNKLDLYNATLDLGKLPGRKKAFAVSAISAEKLDLDMKINPSSEEQVATLFAPLFAQKSWFRFNSLKSSIFNCNWGNLEKTRGSIKGGKFYMTKASDGWKVKIEGGEFNYAWIQEAEILEIEILIKPSHFEVTKCVLEVDGGKVGMKLKLDEGGVNPVISGSGVMQRCDLDSFLREEYRKYVDGVIDSKFSFSGVPNSPTGLSYRFESFEESNVAIRMNAALPVWHALDFLDIAQNYKTYTFDDGQWDLELVDDKITLKNARFSNRSDSYMDLELDLSIGEPSEAVIDGIILGSREPIEHVLEREGLEEKSKELLKYKGGVGAAKPVLEEEDYVTLLKTERHFLGAASLIYRGEPFPTKPEIQKVLAGSAGEKSYSISLEGLVDELTVKDADYLFELGKSQ